MLPLAMKVPLDRLCTAGQLLTQVGFAQAASFNVNGVDNEHMPYDFRTRSDPREFSPNALLYYIR